MRPVEYIDRELKHLFDEGHLFEQVARMEGQEFRSLENRRTVRIESDGHRYFTKTHFGVGWKEIIKNLCQLRMPVLGAENEFRALNALREIGVDSLQPVAYCSKGRNPAQRKSCIVTRALENSISLEELFEDRLLTVQQKRILIPKLAKIARRIHSNGINHRDFYLCHFLVDKSLFIDEELREQLNEKRSEQLFDVSEELLRPFLIDLHRAQIRKSTPWRWQVKDIGGLFFSGFDYDLTRRDVFRFMIHYSGKPLRETLDTDQKFWKAVFSRAEKLYLQNKRVLPDWVKKLDWRQ